MNKKQINSPKVDGQLSLLGWRHGRFAGTLRLENLLRGPEMSVRPVFAKNPNDHFGPSHASILGQLL